MVDKNMRIRLKNWKDGFGFPVLRDPNTAYWVLAFLEKDGHDPEAIIAEIDRVLEELTLTFNTHFKIKMSFDKLSNDTYLFGIFVAFHGFIDTDDDIQKVFEIKTENLKLISIKTLTSETYSPLFFPVEESKILTVTYKLVFPEKKEEDK